MYAKFGELNQNSINWLRQESSMDVKTTRLKLAEKQDSHIISKYLPTDCLQRKKKKHIFIVEKSGETISIKWSELTPTTGQTETWASRCDAMRTHSLTQLFLPKNYITWIYSWPIQIKGQSTTHQNSFKMSTSITWKTNKQKLTNYSKLKETHETTDKKIEQIMIWRKAEGWEQTVVKDAIRTIGEILIWTIH